MMRFRQRRGHQVGAIVSAAVGKRVKRPLLGGSAAMSVSPRQLSIEKNVALMPRSSGRRYRAVAHGVGVCVFDLRSSRDSTLCACIGNGGYERWASGRR
jgi:hypothetical protein